MAKIVRQDEHLSSEIENRSQDLAFGVRQSNSAPREQLSSSNLGNSTGTWESSWWLFAQYYVIGQYR